MRVRARSAFPRKVRFSHIISLFPMKEQQSKTFHLVLFPSPSSLFKGLSISQGTTQCSSLTEELPFPYWDHFHVWDPQRRWERASWMSQRRGWERWGKILEMSQTWKEYGNGLRLHGKEKSFCEEGRLTNQRERRQDTSAGRSGTQPLGKDAMVGDQRHWDMMSGEADSGSFSRQFLHISHGIFFPMGPSVTQARYTE